jgi:hypothetical protein
VATLSKFLSRKFLAAVVAFITVQVIPNLPADQQAKWSAFIAGAYVIGQGLADAFGGGKPSQGETTGATTTGG